MFLTGNKALLIFALIFIVWPQRAAECKPFQLAGADDPARLGVLPERNKDAAGLARHVAEGLEVILAAGDTTKVTTPPSTTTKDDDDGLSTGVLIAIIVGSIVGFIIIVSLLILIICKCCRCNCCDEQSEADAESEAHYSNSGKKNYKQMNGSIQELHIPPAVQEPPADQPYRGALEQMINPLVAAPMVIEQPPPEEFHHEQHHDHHEKKEKKDKKKKEVEADLEPEYNAHEEIAPPPDVHVMAQPHLPISYGPVMPVQPEPAYGGLPHPYVTPQVDIPEYGETAFSNQQSNGPMITADRAATVDGSSPKFLPHLNFAARPQSQPLARPSSENYSESPYHSSSQGYAASSNQAGLRRAPAPGARPLPGMANSSEYRSAYDKKLPRLS